MLGQKEAAPGATHKGRDRWASKVTVALVAGAYLIWTLSRLAVYPSLTSFADDSSNYLVMALHYSPWAPASPAIQSVWPMQYHPPLFPLLLAGSGAAHSLLAAHLFTLALGALAIVVFWRYSIRLLDNSGWALALALIVPLLPGFLLGMQGILSEPLYLLLSIGFLLTWEIESQRRRVSISALILLVSVLLTRSFGVVLVLGLVAQAVFAWKNSRQVSMAALRLAACGALLFFALHFLIMPAGTGEYGSILQGMARNGNELGWLGLSQYVAAQSENLIQSWATFFLVYWRAGSPLFPLMLCLLALSCIGLLHRLRLNRLDAWYVLGSVILLVAWPFPGQMLRFLFPLVPLMLLHAACAIRLVGSRSSLVGLGACLVLAASVLPVHAFLHSRLSAAERLGLVPVYEWLRKPDFELARRDLEVQNAMLEDFGHLRRTSSPSDVIAYYEPSYVALLADRKSIPLAFPADFGAGKLNSASAVLLTRVHPRMSREGLNGLAATGTPSALWCGAGVLTQIDSSCLYLTQSGPSASGRIH